MELAALIGISISDFWSMTISELNIYAKAYVDKEKQRLKDEIALEYMNAAWTRQWLGKRSQQPKSLKDILNNIDKEKKIMTDDEMEEAAKRLNKLLGGEEVEDSV